MQVLAGPTDVVLVRHAESRGNVADRKAHESRADRLELEARDADMPLSDLGERQAADFGRYVARLPAPQQPTAIFASPYARAAHTARLAVSEGGLEVPVEIDERLRERELGAFDGMTGLGIRRLHPEEAGRRERLGKFYYRPPGGESWVDVILRVRQFMLNVSLDRTSRERVWIFTHQAVILGFRTALEHLSEREILDIDASQPMANCAVTAYRADAQGGWELVSLADTPGTGETAPDTHEEPQPDRVVGRGHE